MEKRHKKNVWMSLILCALLLIGTIGVVGNVSGEEENDLDIDDYLILETGTREKPSDDNWDQGDYVAINMTKNGALSWFGVIYGTEKNPNGILIFCAYVRFLGAAEVYEANGNFVGRYPIPVVTVFGQKLFVLFEYKDDGRFYTPLPGVWDDHPEYADNGVFDFVKRDEDPGLWAISDQHEGVTKAINLQRAWHRSQVVESNDPEDTTTKSWDFSIWAEDIDYGIENEKGELILSDPDNKLDKLEFTFHVTANVDEVNITGVPWYEVEVDSGNHKNIIDSKYKTSKDYTGVSVAADFKFDHLREGWDFSGGDGIVLINHGFFANLIPEKVEEWVDEQFIKNIKGHGNAEYEALDPNQEDVVSAVVSNGTEEMDENGDGIVDAKVVKKDVIRFKDNWQEIGELTWVSDAEVDGEDENITYQVHGGQPFSDEDKEGNQLRGFIIQGGYIYPAGNNIYHDPSLVATALLFEVVDYALNLLPGNIVCGQLLIALIAVIVVVALVSVKKRKGKAVAQAQYPFGQSPNQAVPPPPPPPPPPPMAPPGY
ncbi:MAG: hypothetical protein JSV56_01050 [Methanomassiliicoccales archaeon]|nr:MAG: hypothetical protein JSV56_01050 [Methanomassiliicoccales archaeon]